MKKDQKELSGLTDSLLSDYVFILNSDPKGNVTSISLVTADEAMTEALTEEEVDIITAITSHVFFRMVSKGAK